MNSPSHPPRPAAYLALYGALTAIGVIVSVSAFGYGIFLEESRIGPGFLPLVAGLLLAVLGVVLLAGRKRTPTTEEPPPETDVDDAGRTADQRGRILRWVFLLLFVALLLVQQLGIVLSFGLLVFVISTWLENHRLLPALLMSAAGAAALHLLFAVFLRVPLPTGVFGF